mmetsp:Transcript_658/g.2202  ORF Transcript_658/g.2202 Transcript_658/m.2202 type:complete len:296 (+) Transcript_658:109-996(+)
MRAGAIVRYKAPPRSNEYCLNLVKKVDYDQYLVNLLQPADVRQSHAALRAFSIELAHVSDAVTKFEIGAMRMQWFRKAVNGLFRESDPPSHPVLQALKQTVTENKVNRMWLLRMIDGREEDVKFQAPNTIDDMEAYAEKVHASLLYAHLELLGIRDSKADHAASHLGKATGLTQALLATPAAAAKNLAHVPLDLLKKHGVSDKEALTPPHDAKSPITEVFFEVASAAWSHLLTSRKGTQLPRGASKALMVSHVVEYRLEQLRKFHFDPYQRKLQHPGNHVIIGYKLFKNNLFGRF